MENDAAEEIPDEAVPELEGENDDAEGIPGEAVPDYEGENDVDGAVSDSSSSSHSNSNSGSDSDGESVTSEVTTEKLDPFTDGRLVRVREIAEQDQFVLETDEQNQSVKNGFLSVMSNLGLRTAVEAVLKNAKTGYFWQARLRAFQEVSRGLEKTGEGWGKVKYVWFGGPKREIDNIFRYGFASRGRGICLSPFLIPSSSLRSCVADENGLFHMILCRAVLGRSELIPPANSQQFPSTEEFQSGVDSLSAPRRYMVWSPFMNTHVLPQYVVSFRPPVKANEGSQIPALANPVRENEGAVNAATSADPTRMAPFLILIHELAMVLPMDSIRKIQKHYSEFRDGKITKKQVIQKLREFAGDDVLSRTIMAIRRRNGASAAPGNSNEVVRAERKASAKSSANRVIKKLRGSKSG